MVFLKILICAALIWIAWTVAIKLYYRKHNDKAAKIVVSQKLPLLLIIHFVYMIALCLYMVVLVIYCFFTLLFS